MLLTRDMFRRLCRAREMLVEIPEERLTIAEIAREIRLSEFYFIRQFQTLCGVTPHQFRLQSRIDRAKLLLAKSELSVTEVCMEIGFSSVGTFSSLFSRRVGTSPVNYQRNARMLVSVPGQIPQKLFPGCLSLMAFLPASAFRNFREA